MNACTLCGLPVLELEGQFENLEPYCAEPLHPAAEIAGQCHSSCIAASEHGRMWCEWRVRSYSTGRGYRLVAEQDGWSVLIHARHPELLAFHSEGTSIGAERDKGSSGSKAAAGGLLVPVDEEFNLEHDDIGVINEIQARLRNEGQYPIPRLLDVLGIADRVRWPQALDNAVFVFDKELEEEWTGTGIGMRASYFKFLPEVVVPFWKQL